MTKYFTIATDPLSAEEEIKVRELFSGNATWWHWLPNHWLVRDNSDELDAQSIMQSIQSINSTARAIILEVSPKTWAALTRPNAKGKDMGTWLRNHWKQT